MQTKKLFQYVPLAGLALVSSAFAPLCQAQWTVTTAQPTAWFKADAGVTANGSGVVSAWADQSGNGFNLSNTGGNQPTIAVVPALNNQNAIQFNGTSGNVLFNSSVDGATFTSATASTVFLVQIDNGGPSETSISLSWLNSGSGDRVAAYAAYSNGLFYDHGTSQAGDEIGASPVPGGYAGTPQVLTFQRNASSGLIRANGTDFTTGTFANPLNTAQSGTLSLGGVGTDTSSSLNLNGSIAEVVVFKSALSGSDISAVESYLGNKYGISAVPEPSQYATVFAVACGLGALILRRRRQTLDGVASH